MGALAEIPTEVAQQMIERAQAGLSLTDQDALNECGQTAYQVGLLGPIGAAGRLAERGAASDGARAEQGRGIGDAQSDDGVDLDDSWEAVEAALVRRTAPPAAPRIAHADSERMLASLRLHGAGLIWAFSP